jgi:hypothetical protein
MKLTMEIDEELIQEHGLEIDRPRSCPCHAFLASHGYPNAVVTVEALYLEPAHCTLDGLFASWSAGSWPSVRWPQEFREWQLRGMNALTDGHDPRTVLEPITFVVDVPGDPVPA